MTKNLNIIALAVIAEAIVVLYVLNFTSTPTCQAETTSKNDTCSVVCDSSSALLSDKTSDYPVAYVNVALLQEKLQKFDFYKKWNEKLLQKEAESTNKLKSEQKRLQAELEVFQQKYQAGGFLTKESLEQEQNRLMKKDQDLQAMQMRLEQEFANEQIKLTNQLMDTIDTFFKTYNREGRYKLIINRAEVLYADTTMDITQDVLNKMDERYGKKVKK